MSAGQEEFLKIVNNGCWLFVVVGRGYYRLLIVVGIDNWKMPAVARSYS